MVIIVDGGAGEAEDEHGEIHEITFHLIDSSYIAFKLDGTEILNIGTEV